MKGVAVCEDVARLSVLDYSAMNWPCSSFELIARAAAEWPEHPALTFLPDPAKESEAVRFTFVELLNTITRAANLFHTLGVERGDVVAYALPNLPQTHFALWGAEAVGIALPINPMLSAEQIAALLQTSGTRLFITTAALWDVISSYAPKLDHVLIVGEVPPSRDGRQLIDFNKAVTSQSGEGLRFKPPGNHDLCSWFCTGGTTGAPKIAMRSHRAETGNAMMFAATMGDHNGPGRVYLCGLPLFHVNAITATGLLPWVSGGEIILAGPDGYRAPALIKNFWKIVARWRVNFFSGVPTIYARLLEVPVGDSDISSLDAAICGAAPMPTELFRRFEAATGVRILEGYGLTEGGCVSTINPIDGERRIGSIGLNLPWQEICVALLDDAGVFVRECGVDEVGSILISGPNVFEGYRDPVHDKGIWINIGDGKRWLNTGDLGRYDMDGYYWLTGRRKELIIRGGHNIDPAIIEEALNGHPAVAMTAAVPRPDSDAGEVPVAYVQLRDGMTVGEAELIAYARATITERAAVPRAIRIIPALPLTPVGKIFKPALVLREIEGVTRSTAAARGIAVGSVTARQDPVCGAVVTISGATDFKALAAALAVYVFKTEFICKEK